MRHGLAESEFDSDFSRALSHVGKKQATDIALQIQASEDFLPTNMLVSPFRRTQETAQIVHEILKLETPFESEELLVHFADHQLLGEFLLQGNFEHLMIISHMPIVARLCQYLSPKCNIYGFHTAQVVKLNFDIKNNALVDKVYLPKGS